MLKKILVGTVFMVMISGLAHAGQLTAALVDKTTMSNSVSTVAGDIDTNDSNKVAFFVVYDSAESTAGVTATVTAAISYDGVNWVPAYWNDFDTATTRVATKSLTTDGTYYGWFNIDQPMPKLQIRVTMDNAAVYGGTETADVTVKVIKDN